MLLYSLYDESVKYFIILFINLFYKEQEEFMVLAILILSKTYTALISPPVSSDERRRKIIHISD